MGTRKNNHFKKYLAAIIGIWGLLLLSSTLLLAQDADSLNTNQSFEKILKQLQKERKRDSIKRHEFEKTIQQLSVQLLKEANEKENIKSEITQLKKVEQERELSKIALVDSLRKQVDSFPIFGLIGDTLFSLHIKSGMSNPQERAQLLNEKLRAIYESDHIEPYAIKVQAYGTDYEILYRDQTLLTLNEFDALWHKKQLVDLSNEIAKLMQDALMNAQIEQSDTTLFKRIAWVILVIVLAFLSYWGLRKLTQKVSHWISLKGKQWFKDFKYKDYTYLSSEQATKLGQNALKIIELLLTILILYISLPIIFSIFPYSRRWADTLFGFVWEPFKGILVSVWNYVPNFFSILVIFMVIRYVNRIVRYLFLEIAQEKLKIKRFHADWAMSTYSIVRFLLYAFMFVIIFPYLPGSDSQIFKGVSVFIGIVFSFGSSSLITNTVSGIVLTYMRPFKLGDRIKIGEIIGDVVEKNLLVTRVRSTKNVIITIPNSNILTGNTINYSSLANDKGLVVHTTLTLGYDIPWRKIETAFIEAALLTPAILSEPKPFVLQTSLDDFYVSYQLNAYTLKATEQERIYSQLHQNLQDVCAKHGIEIMSPHYQAFRDGSPSTIPLNENN